MSATKTKKQKEEKKLVFPSQAAFDYFLEEFVYMAKQSDATDEGIEEMKKLLTENFGQNLPEEDRW